eukprot:m.82758 g.82758  ORF g.82758 m.82758 type:complete len:301 (+) comp14932_c0_seq1:119-1021(+)
MSADVTLTLYELHRQRQPVIEDDREVQMPLSALHNEMKCPICLCIIEKTMTTMECMHRFCSECITKSLRFGKKECPTCRTPCPSRRSLRPDANMDKLIALVYPDVSIFELQHEQFMQHLHKNTNVLALRESIEHGMKDQARVRFTRTTSTAKPAQADVREGEVEESETDEGSEETDPSADGDSESRPKRRRDSFRMNDPVEFYALPHPELVEAEKDTVVILQNKYMRTPQTTMIGHIAKYISIMRSLEGTSDEDLEHDIYLQQGSKYVRLPLNKPLSAVLAMWDRAAPFALYYMPTGMGS